MNPLEKYTQQAKSAHNWTSFNPDKAGERTIQDYSAMLINDLKEIESMDQETQKQYVERFERFFVSLLSSMSNCASAMITGPANFPSAKMERNRNRERAKYEAFMEWRTKAKRAIKRKATEPKTFDSELERYTRELERHGNKRNRI